MRGGVISFKKPEWMKGTERKQREAAKREEQQKKERNEYYSIPVEERVKLPYHLQENSELREYLHKNREEKNRKARNLRKYYSYSPSLRNHLIKQGILQEREDNTELKAHREEIQRSKRELTTEEKIRSLESSLSTIGDKLFSTPYGPGQRAIVEQQYTSISQELKKLKSENRHTQSGGNRERLRKTRRLRRRT